MNIDEFIEYTKEKAEEYKYRACFFKRGNPMYAAYVKLTKDHEQLVEWLEKFKEYQQLEEQGRLVKLPCKVGDTVYVIVGKNISAQKIQRATIDSERKIEFCTKRRGFTLFDIGKTVFLTKSEAEAKLKELRGEQNGKI